MLRKHYLSLVVFSFLFFCVSISQAASLEPFTLKLPYEDFIQKYNTVNGDNPYIPQIVNLQETGDIEEIIFLTDRPHLYIDTMGLPYHDGTIDCIVLWTERFDEDLNYLTNAFLGVLNTMDFSYTPDSWIEINRFFDEIVNKKKRTAQIELVNKNTNEKWVCTFERHYNKYTNRFESHRIAIYNDLFYKYSHKKS